MTLEQREKIDAMLRNRPEMPGGIAEQRARYAAQMGERLVPEGIDTSETTLAGLRTLVIEPTGPSQPGTILFLHGGGYMLGSPETELGLAANLVTRTGRRAYSVDYRLAPEHPFPAGVDDAFAAYRALLDTGADPSQVALAGDSAGGSLCVTTLLKARDAGLPMPAAVAVFSAALDFTATGASMDDKEGIDPIFNRAVMNAIRPVYLAGADPNQELLSPATLADAKGFPPMLLQVGGNEVLLDDSTRMAERLREAGVDVILDITADVPHVFQIYAGILDEADHALDRAALFLRQHLTAN